MAKKNKLSSITTDMPAPVAYKQSPQDRKREMRYQAEDAIRTLTRADEIRKNKPLMKEVKCVVKEQVKAITKASGR